MTFHIITLFPGAFDSYLGESILKRAIEEQKIKVKMYNLRDYADDEWNRVDRKAYGGGPGMVIQALPVAKAIEKAVKACKGTKKGTKGKQSAVKPRIKIIFFNPSGKEFNTAYAKNSAKKYDNIIFVCGRYEGIDARVKKMFKNGRHFRGTFCAHWRGTSGHDYDRFSLSSN